VAAALDLADPDAREFLERAAVTDVDADPVLEARNLIAAATRRQLALMVSTTGSDQLRAITEARVSLDQIDDPERADLAAEALLGWLQGASEGDE